MYRRLTRFDPTQLDPDLIWCDICCRWLTPRMLAMKLFTDLYHDIPSATAEHAPPLARGLLQQCATGELLGWLLESTASQWGGERCCP
jgi:hypothetical protein